MVRLDKRRVDVKKSKPFTDRYGNIIRISPHTRYYDKHPPKISRKDEEAIKSGSAKRLSREINIFQNDDDTWWVIAGEEGDPNNDLLGVWDTKKEAEEHKADVLMKQSRKSRKICNRCGNRVRKYADPSRKLCLKCVAEEDRAIFSLGKGKSQMVKCKECGAIFPIEAMRGQYCHICADNREIIRLWKKGKTKKEIAEELDYLPYARIESAIKDEIKDLEDQEPRG